MTASYAVQTKIVGIDAASEVFQKVGRAAAAAFAPMERLNKAINTPHVNHLGRVGRWVDDVSAKFRNGVKSIAAWAPALAGLGAAGTLAGLWENARHAAEGYEGLALAAEKLGMTRSELAGWRFSAKMAGVENETFEKGMVRLNRAIHEAASGKSKDLANLFARMGINLKKANGEYKTAGEVLPEVAESFHRTTDESTRTAMAMVLMGKSGADLLPMLDKGREKLVAEQAEKKKWAGLTDLQQDSLEHLAHSMKIADAASSGLSSKLGAVFAPVVSMVLDRTNDWIAANRDLIAQALERKIDRIERSLRLAETAFGDVTAAIGIDKWWAGIDATDKFDAALGVLGVALAGPVLAGLQLATGWILRMNAAVLANPVVAFGAALVAVAVEAALHWQEVKDVVSGALEALKEPFGVLKAGAELANLAVNLLFAGINDVSKALFGIDMEKWSQDFDRWIGKQFDWVNTKAKELLEWMSRIKNVFSGGNTFGGNTVGGNEFGGQTFGGQTFGASAAPAPALAAPAPDSPAAIMAGGGGPQKVAVDTNVKITIAGAPPGTKAEGESTSKGSTPAPVGYRFQDAM